MRFALGQHDGHLCRLLLGFQHLQPRRDGRRGEETADALGDDARDARHRQFAGGRQQPVAVRQVAGIARGPLAFFVEFADDARAHVIAPVVQLFLQLVFEQLALFLDDEDFLQPFGEVAHAFRLERPDHADLVQANADLRGQRLASMPSSSSAWRTSR